MVGCAKNAPSSCGEVPRQEQKSVPGVVCGALACVLQEGAENAGEEMGEAVDEAGDSMEEGWDEVTEDDK